MISLRTITSSVFVCAALLVGACGGQTISAPSPAAEQSACSDYAKATCARLSKCDSSFMMSEYAGDVARCEQAETTVCMGSFATPGMNVSPDFWEACAEARSATACGAKVAACTLPDGTLRDGAPCLNPDQCAGGTCLRSGPTTPCGACATLAAGECSLLSRAQCPVGDACIVNDTSSDTMVGKCVTPSPAGGPCGVGSFCAPGLACEGGTCTPAPPGSEPCGGSCGPGEVCQGGACVPITYAPVGQACSDAVECAGGICANGTCVGFLSPGAPCDESPAYCDAGYACWAGRCVPFSTAAASCGG